MARVVKGPASLLWIDMVLLKSLVHGASKASRRAIPAGIRLGGVILVFAACEDVSTVPDDPTSGDLYLEEALDTLQAHSLHRYGIEWPELRQAVREKANRPETPADAYPAIRYAFSLVGEEHSWFLTPAEYSELRDEPHLAPPLIKLETGGPMVDVPVGYVRVPPMSGSSAEASAMTAIYHEGIERVDQSSVCGWIVDLRGNWGGNMSPMIAGIGPIVGEGVLGYFVDPDSATISWEYEEGTLLLDGRVTAGTEAPYVLRNEDPPVVVLVNRWTASAAEAAFIAFKGRPNTHSIGQSTRGLSTANRGFELSDGALMVITTSVMADRTGRLYGGRVDPDTFLGEWPQTLDLETDGTYREAFEWLVRRESCAVG